MISPAASWPRTKCVLWIQTCHCPNLSLASHSATFDNLIKLLGFWFHHLLKGIVIFTLLEFYEYWRKNIYLLRLKICFCHYYYFIMSLLALELGESRSLHSHISFTSDGPSFIWAHLHILTYFALILHLLKGWPQSTKLTLWLIICHPQFEKYQLSSPKMCSPLIPVLFQK